MSTSCHLCVGLARAVYMHVLWPHIWWFPCQEYCIYTVNIWFWPTLVMSNLLIAPSVFLCSYNHEHAYVGLTPTINMHHIWPYVLRKMIYLHTTLCTHHLYVWLWLTYSMHQNLMQLICCSYTGFYPTHVGLTRTARCIYSILGKELTRCTVGCNVYIWFWPTLYSCVAHN
jgi:hypothetical protein